MIDEMEEPVIIVSLLVLLGSMFGSFAAAQVWRLRGRQLGEDLAEGETVDQDEYRALHPLNQSSMLSDRSRCLRCSHVLAWYDLLPLASWLMLKGRCRYCKSPIGLFEPLMEIGVAAVFVTSYLLWPYSLESASGLLALILWLVAVVMLAVLFAYDLKWFLLPDEIIFPLIGVGILMSVAQIAGTLSFGPALLDVMGSILALSGLYFFLWFISRGRWVGFGDVKLGLALALLLADWRLALVALFSANLIGSLLVIPGMLTGKLNRKSHVPFGPLLIAGAVIAMIVGDRAISWYIGVLF